MDTEYYWILTCMGVLLITDFLKDTTIDAWALPGLTDVNELNLRALPET